MLWIVLITYGVIGCSDRCFVTFPAGVYYLHFGGEGSYILTLPLEPTSILII